MLKNFFRMAWRSLFANKTSTIINIGGLTVGMAVATLIGLWIYEELSFDKSSYNFKNVAQVMQHQHFNGDVRTEKAISIPLANALRQDYGSDFKHVILSSWTNAHILSYEEKHLSATGNYMEPGAVNMLSLKMNYGLESGLQEKYSVLLSQSLSNKLFGNIDPTGRIIELDTSHVKVTGVYNDISVNNTFNTLSFIAPWDLYADDPEIMSAANDWGANSFQLFVQTSEGSDMDKISQRLSNASNKSLSDNATLKSVFFLHPMKQWHLYSEFKNGINVGGKIQYLWMFGIIGLFVLLLACINFMNLSTARSEKRAKEVGIRKTVGSNKSQLILQFLSESLLAALFAFACSLILVQLILPYFNTIAGKETSLPWNNPMFWLLELGFTMFTGLLAGSYPAFYLSSFRPVKVLKGPFKAGRYSTLPRKVLVVLQFTISIILILGTITVFRQIQFGKNREIGYNLENLVIIRPYTEDFHNHLEAVRHDLTQTGLITDVAEGSFISKGSRTSGGLQWKGKDPTIQDNFMTFCVSPEYGKVVGWQMISGRDFSKEFSTDSAGIILNEAAVAYMGLSDPIGEIIGWDKKYTVIGVTKNIVMRSPFDPVMPTLYYTDNRANYLNIKIKSGSNERSALTAIETVYKKYSPSSPFEYKFADEEFDKKFVEEERTRSLATVFAILAIFISCLGLFGLASFVSEQRKKEIGIRKVMGASVVGLWRKMSGDFILLVILSLVIAIPVAYYLLHAWLQNYQYRTELSWWIFALTGGGAIMITLLTVSFHALKSAISNPLKSLRTE